MRHPPDGNSGTSDSTGETARETWSHTAFPQTTDETPPASVARKTPRPTRRSDVSLTAGLHVGHAGEQLAAQIPGVALGVDPDDVRGGLRLDQGQRLRRDGAAALRRVCRSELRDDHAGRVANRGARDAFRLQGEGPAEPSLRRHRLEIDDAVLAHACEPGAESGVHRVRACRAGAERDCDGGNGDRECLCVHRESPPPSCRVGAWLEAVSAPFRSSYEALKSVQRADDAGGRSDRRHARRQVAGDDCAGSSMQTDRVSRTRCAWVPLQDPLYVAYHDEERGVPSHDERALYELLTLEGAQAGLSWSTILHKREGYRSAFAGFDAEAVARFEQRDVERLLGEPGSVRNRRKGEPAVGNAQRVLEIREEHGSFAEYVWRFVGGGPLVGSWSTVGEIPAETAESRALSKDLKQRGFRFVGPTVCYAFMQAAGLVDDHTLDCFRRAPA